MKQYCDVNTAKGRYEETKTQQTNKKQINKQEITMIYVPFKSDYTNVHI
jgi:hypothetical protein